MGDNKISLNEWLATEVMGWEKEIPDLQSILYQQRWIMHRDEQAGYIDEYCLAEDWNPTTDPKQTKMCLEKFVKNRMEAADFTIMFSKDANPLIQVFDFQGEALFETHCEYEELSLAICQIIQQAIEK